MGKLDVLFGGSNEVFLRLHKLSREARSDGTFEQGASHGFGGGMSMILAKKEALWRGKFGIKKECLGVSVIFLHRSSSEHNSLALFSICHAQAFGIVQRDDGHPEVA
ncbi:MAG: hypothetical protein NVS4B1_05260 [Ktedonobacteraceae bacterium]